MFNCCGLSYTIDCITVSSVQFSMIYLISHFQTHVAFITNKLGESTKLDIEDTLSSAMQSIYLLVFCKSKRLVICWISSLSLVLTKYVPLLIVNFRNRQKFDMTANRFVGPSRPSLIERNTLVPRASEKDCRPCIFLIE